jgi:Tfp pilus assembly protein PilF
LQAAVHVLLRQEPVVDTVSWMVPVSRALAEGGIQAANECYAEIKDDPNYFFDEDELFNLAYQVQSVQKFDRAMDVLELNLQVFPQHLDSLLMLARLCLRQEDRPRAEAALYKVLQIQPANPTALELLAELKRGS